MGVWSRKHGAPPTTHKYERPDAEHGSQNIVRSLALGLVGLVVRSLVFHRPHQPIRRFSIQWGSKPMVILPIEIMPRVF